jgi:hypothetical protein
MTPEEIAEVAKTVGPKRVKTPTHEVEQHSLRDLLQATERTKPAPVGLNSFHFDIVKPKHGCYCKDSKSGIQDCCE